MKKSKVLPSLLWCIALVFGFVQQASGELVVAEGIANGAFASTGQCSNLCSSDGDGRAETRKPNILLILVDDMGYGDPKCFNPKSRLKTPAIDRLAREGLMFTDAHAPHSTCIASRYGLLTGRYPIRDMYRFIKPGKITLPKLLKRNGYNTGMIGKWHLGFDNFKGKDGTAKQTMTGGPVDRGFDEFFGLWGSLDQPPYFYMKNRTPVEMPTEDGKGKHYFSKDRFYNGNWLPGKIASHFKHVEVTPRLTSEAYASSN